MITVTRMAGSCLILLGIINVLHEIVVVNAGRGKPGIVYGLVTAAFFAIGVALLLRPKHTDKQEPAKSLSKD
jgi:hypothetical protein